MFQTEKVGNNYSITSQEEMYHSRWFARGGNVGPGCCLYEKYLIRCRRADGTPGMVWFKWTVHQTRVMYNLTVDTAHTFFVGYGQWLVHNTCNPLSRLPIREGAHDSTTGILVAGDQEITLTSGRVDPGFEATGGKGSGFDAYTRTHVEGHASAWMRQNNVTAATLYINNPPCPNCTRNLPSMLPRNSVLDIFGPNGYFKRFFGLPE